MRRTWWLHRLSLSRTNTSSVASRWPHRRLFYHFHWSTMANDSQKNKSEAILLIFRPPATGIARQCDFLCWFALSRLLLCCYVLLFVTFTGSSNTRLHTGCDDQSPCNLILGRSKDKVRNIAKIWSLGHYQNFLHFLILQAIKQKHRL